MKDNTGRDFYKRRTDDGSTQGEHPKAEHRTPGGDAARDDGGQGVRSARGGCRRGGQGVRSARGGCRRGGQGVRSARGGRRQRTKEGPAPRTRSRRQSRPGAGEAALSAQGGPSLPSPRQIDETLRDILRQATPDAARLLVQAIGNEQLSFSLRIDCAKDVLNRIYGKQAPPEQPGSVRFVLEEELERYAK